MRAEYLNKSKRDGIEMMDQFHQKQFFLFIYFMFHLACFLARDVIEEGTK